MKETYAEANNKSNFDWWSALQEVKDSSEPDRDFIAKLVDLSGEWVTCACGNLCDVIPRHSSGAPQDGQLRDLGYKFHADIFKINWNDALETLEKIEERSTEILREMGILA